MSHIICKNTEPGPAPDQPIGATLSTGGMTGESQISTPLVHGLDGKSFLQNQLRLQQSMLNAGGYERVFLDSLRLRLPDYLRLIGVDLTQEGVRLSGLCPMHADRNPSFAVYGDDLTMCGCYPCDFKGDVFALAMKLKRADNFRQAVEHVVAVLGGEAEALNGVEYAKPRVAKQPATPRELTAAERELIASARQSYAEALTGTRIEALARELGLSVKTMAGCAVGGSGLGLHNGKLAYIYPSGMKVRNSPGCASRFYWPCGSPLHPWRWERVGPTTKTIYLAEGETDCLALLEAGLESDQASACIASPGTSFSERWAPLFTGRAVVLGFDADNAGRPALHKVARMIQPYATTIRAIKHHGNR